jgi:hypothetical protein
MRRKPRSISGASARTRFSAAGRYRGRLAQGRPRQRRQAGPGGRIRLQSELDAAQREIARLRDGYDAGNDWDWQDTPEEIAKAMLRSHPVEAKRVVAAILALSKLPPRRSPSRW